MIIQRLFSSKEQKARRAKWDKKVAKDIWGGQLDKKKAKQIGRDTQRRSTVSLDNGKARVNYENSKIQDLTKRGNNEILNAVNGEKKLNSEAFDKIVNRSKELDSRIISKTVEKDLPVEDKLNKLTKSSKLQIKLIGRQNNLKNLEDKAIEKAKNNKKLKENLKKGGKIALATGGVVAAGIGAKKLADKKKAEKKKK